MPNGQSCDPGLTRCSQQILQPQSKQGIPGLEVSCLQTHAEGSQKPLALSSILGAA